MAYISEHVKRELETMGPGNGAPTKALEGADEQQ